MNNGAIPSRGLSRKLDLRATLQVLWERYPGIENVYLFGSRAHGSKSLRSDFDLIVEMKGVHLHDFMWDVRRVEPYLDFFVHHGSDEIQSLINHSIIRQPNMIDSLGAKLIWKDGAWCGDSDLREHQVLEDWSPGITISIDPHDSWRDPAVACEVLLITALESERGAISEALLNQATRDGLNQKVRLSSVGDAIYQIRTSTQRTISVVLPLPSGRGNVRSGVRTAQVLSRWDPASIALVGIAGGDRRNLKLGDVLLGASAVEYESAKIEQGGEQRFDGSITELTPSIRSAILSWPQAQSVLDAAMTKHNLQHRPTVRDAVIASGEKVINDQAFIDQVQAIHRRAVGVEMELIGVLTATLESDALHKPAMAVLAEFVVELIGDGILSGEQAG